MVLLAVNDSLIAGLPQVLRIFSSVLGASFLFSATLPLVAISSTYILDFGAIGREASPKGKDIDQPVSRLRNRA